MFTIAHGATPGLATPETSIKTLAQGLTMPTSPKKTPTGSTAGAKQNTHGAIVTQHDAERFAALSARAVLAGQHLTQATNGFILSRWTYSKHCADLDTVEHLLDTIAGTVNHRF